MVLAFCRLAVEAQAAKRLSRMPRTTYKPFTLYEEFLGHKGARRLAMGMFSIVGFNTAMLMGLWLTFGAQSRHATLSPVENAAINEQFEERFDRLAGALHGAEQRQLSVRRNLGPR